MTALALHSAAAGHRVTLLMAPYPQQHSPLVHAWGDLKRHFTSHPGDITLHYALVDQDGQLVGSSLPPSSTEAPPYKSSDGCLFNCRYSWQLLRWVNRYLRDLKAEAEDANTSPLPVVMHLLDTGGLGYWITAASHMELLPFPALTVVGSHGPHLWERMANEASLLMEDHLELDFMERAAVEEAHWTIAPSTYILQWMEQHGWTPAPNQAVQINLTPPPPPTERYPRPLPSSQGAKRLPLSEVVFFGRLESRKGLTIFLDALTLFFAAAKVHHSGGGQALSNLTVTFLGDDTTLNNGDKASKMIYKECGQLRRLFQVDLSCQVMSDVKRPAALTYLRREIPQGKGKVLPPLAVMASPIDNSPYTVLECIEEAVPFLAAGVGGVPELLESSLSPASLPVSRWTFEPSPRALSEALMQAWMHGIERPQRLSSAAKDIEQAWAQWHALVPMPLPTPIKEESVVRVSVCLIYPGQVADLGTLARPILHQQVGHVKFELQLLVVLVADIPGTVNSTLSTESIHQQVKELLTSLHSPSSSTYSLRVVALPFRHSASVVSYFLWTGEQEPTSDLFLFLEPHDTLLYPTSLSTLIDSLTLTQSHQVSAFQYSPSSDTVHLSLGCRQLYGLTAVSNCYSSRNLLITRQVLERHRATGFGYEDGVRQWHMQSELEGMRFRMIPDVAFHRGAIKAQPPAKVEGSDWREVVSGMTAWHRSSAYALSSARTGGTTIWRNPSLLENRSHLSSQAGNRMLTSSLMSGYLLQIISKVNSQQQKPGRG